MKKLIVLILTLLSIFVFSVEKSTVSPVPEQLVATTRENNLFQVRSRLKFISRLFENCF